MRRGHAAPFHRHEDTDHAIVAAAEAPAPSAPPRARNAIARRDNGPDPKRGANPVSNDGPAAHDDEGPDT